MSVLAVIRVDDLLRLVAHFQKKSALGVCLSLCQLVIIHQIIHHLGNDVRQSAGIIPNVKDEALCTLGDQCIHRFLKLVKCSLDKLIYLDIADAVFQHFIIYGDILDLTTGNFKFQHFLLTGTIHHQIGCGICGAPDKGNHLLQLHIRCKLLIIYLNKDILRKKPHFLRRTSLERLDDVNRSFLLILAHRSTDAYILSRIILRNSFILLRGIIGGILIIQPLDQPLIVFRFLFFGIQLIIEIIFDQLIDDVCFLLNINRIQIKLCLRLLALRRVRQPSTLTVTASAASGRKKHRSC